MNVYEQLAIAFHEHFTEDPNRCVALGVDQRLGELPDPTLEFAEARLGRARRLLEKLKSRDESALSADEALDLELAELMLEADIHDASYRFNDKSQLAQLPSAADDIGDGIFLLMTNDPRPAAERLANIQSRLECVPGYLQALLRRLNTPVERWVKMDRDKVSGLDSLFESVESWAKDEGYPGLSALSTAKQEALVALRQYLKDLKRLPTTTAFHVGRQTAQRIVRLRGIELGLDELHKMASSFLGRVKKEIEALAGKLIRKYQLDANTSVEALERYLNDRFRVIDKGDDLGKVLDLYEKELRRATEYVKGQALFKLLGDECIKILRTPKFMEPTIPAGAMLSPAPFRSSTPTSLIYLTLSNDLLDEHTKLSIPSMIIHEAMPGHHLQLASAAQHPSLIRRHVDAMEQAEGWTTMLEDYMLDLGYMGDLTDEARFIGKRDISRIGARVAIDLYFMTGDKHFLEVGVDCDLSSDDPFVAAGNLLSKVTGFSEGRVQAELNWYSQQRGYPLSYLTGNTLVWQLKADLAKSQAGKLEGLDLDREFHRVYLEAGNMPLPFLRKVFVREGLLAV